MAYNLKNEEDVRLYLKNLYTEYQFGCYGEKNPEVCHLLGDYYESLKKDFAKAADLYQKNCDNLDYGRSCAKFGGWSMVGKGCAADVARGYNYLARACELGDAIGCTNAGIVGLSEARLHAEDRAGAMKQAVRLLEKGCNEKRQERACSFLSGMYHRGIEGVVEPNRTQTYNYALKACEFGNYHACSHVSNMHATGEGAQKSSELAEAFKKRALELERDIKHANPTLRFGQGIEV
ncbi:cytochrome c oxidase assembly factor 7 homolog [Phymastichus coffea]|uniref:cytochrome c oxidase assembly factor 7 homolog n=1 Tax=Phymastichus coffea TaxID=108790 RepID=UPI00273BEB6E|nr:cytochrome c oxidase assembly factor 7 homolog [Phymastichus coffea]XP_058796075.1 cytochrome c oxidase assembly factor 7 homolog [Phymastichus coffea]